MDEKLNSQDALFAKMVASHGLYDILSAEGVYTAELYEYEGGPLIWAAQFDNVVCTNGKNLALDSYLSGSSYTVTGPYLGIISSTSFSAVSASDTMASHAGWLEGGGGTAPTYSGTRATATFASASAGAKTLASAAVFNFTGTGSVQGAFLTFGSGAVSTIGSTAGTLYSAGTLAVPQPVINGNVLNINYTTSL